jgi:hypothetical protein
MRQPSRWLAMDVFSDFTVPAFTRHVTIYIGIILKPTTYLRAVGGDRKGSLKFETVKYGHEYQGTRTRERLRWQDH